MQKKSTAKHEGEKDGKSNKMNLIIYFTSFDMKNILLSIWRKKIAFYINMPYNL